MAKIFRHVTLVATRSQTGFAFCILRFAFCILLSLPLHAAEERSISVTGNGQAAARPNRLEIELQAGGTAELTDDAIVKYDDSLRRVSVAFEGLKIEGLKIERGDLSFASLMQNNNAVRGRNAPPKPQISVHQSLKLTLDKIDQLSQKQLVATVGKLVDTAHDAGATITGGQRANMIVNQFGGRVMVNNQPGQPTVAFVLSDFETLHDQAYQKAFDDAVSRAEKLAKLARVQLGEVLSISETSQPNYGLNPYTGSYPQALVSVHLSEIPVNVSLHVRFALVGRAAEAAKDAHNEIPQTQPEVVEK